MKALSYILNLVGFGQLVVCAWGMVGLGLAMTMVILIQIFFRFVVYQPVPWSEEAARYLMIWMGMLGSVLAMRMGRHIGVTAVMDRLPEAWRAGGAKLVDVCLFLFLGIICYQGWELAWFNSMQLSAAMEISMTIPYLAIPIGCAMMMIDILARMLNQIRPTAPGDRTEAFLEKVYGAVEMIKLED